MPQEQLFEMPTSRIEYERRAGHRRGYCVHLITVYDDDNNAVIFIETEVRYKRSIEKELSRVAREAFLLMKTRPFGDEYTTDLCHVSYLFEK